MKIHLPLLLQSIKTPLKQICGGVCLLLFFAIPAPAQELDTTAPITISVFGDSLVHGYGLSPNDGFVPQLSQAITTTVHTNRPVRFVNAGVSGDTTAGGLARIDWALTPEIAAVIVVLGGNDILRGIDPLASRANLRAILQKITNRHLPILLIGVPVIGNYGAEYQSAFADIYPDLAQEFNVVYAPNFFAGLGMGNGDSALDTSAVLLRYMQADGLHPNAAGVRRIVATLTPSVLSLLKRVDVDPPSAVKSSADH